MEYQGKSEKQVKDSERIVFWGVAFVFIIIVLIALAPGSGKNDPPPRSLRDSTVELLKKDRDSLVYINDSLTGELFRAEIELNRYEIAYKIFLKRDPQGAKVYGDIISDETE